MSSKIRAVLVGLFCLIVGFLAGRSLRPSAPPQPPTQSIPVKVATLPVTPSAAAQSGNMIGTAASPSGVEQRRELLTWFKQHNLHFGNWGSVGPSGFDKNMALILGLSPEELTALDAAAAQTNKSVYEIKVQAASGRVSEDGQLLVVHVPSLPREGAEIFTEFLAKVRAVLGPERYALYNELAGDGFERAFDNYGLTAMTYELNLQPVSTSGQRPVYILKSSSIDPEQPESRNWSITQMPKLDPEMIDPVVLKFLSPKPNK